MRLFLLQDGRQVAASEQADMRIQIDKHKEHNTVIHGLKKKVFCVRHIFGHRNHQTKKGASASQRTGSTWLKRGTHQKGAGAPISKTRLGCSRQYPTPQFPRWVPCTKDKHTHFTRKHTQTCRQTHVPSQQQRETPTGKQVHHTSTSCQNITTTSINVVFVPSLLEQYLGEHIRGTEKSKTCSAKAMLNTEHSTVHTECKFRL